MARTDLERNNNNKMTRLGRGKVSNKNSTQDFLNLKPMLLIFICRHKDDFIL
jgi:hypothetical protein